MWPYNKKTPKKRFYETSSLQHCYKALKCVHVEIRDFSHIQLFTFVAGWGDHVADRCISVGSQVKPQQGTNHVLPHLHSRVAHQQTASSV